MKNILARILILISLLLYGCAAVDYGLILNDYRGEFLNVENNHGKRYYKAYIDQLSFSPLNKKVVDEHLRLHGPPKFLYCQGQLNNFFIYDNGAFTAFHFDTAPIGILSIRPIDIDNLPSKARQYVAELQEHRRQEELQEQRRQEQLRQEQLRQDQLRQEQQKQKEQKDQWEKEYEESLPNSR